MRGVTTAYRIERGSILVEAAIVLPVLLIIIAGFIEFGFAFRERALLTDCLRVAARILSVQEEINWSAATGPSDSQDLRDALHVAINDWQRNVGLDPDDFDFSLEAAAMPVGSEIIPFWRLKIDRKPGEKRSVLWPTVSVSSCVSTFISARIGGKTDELPLEHSLPPVCG